MDLTANHYAQLLGIQSPWKITSVDLDIDALRVDIRVLYEGESGQCPECGKASKVYDQSLNCGRRRERRMIWAV
jgi:hypothetical protein